MSLSLIYTEYIDWMKSKNYFNFFEAVVTALPVLMILGLTHAYKAAPKNDDISKWVYVFLMWTAAADVYAGLNPTEQITSDIIGITCSAMMVSKLKIQTKYTYFRVT